MAGKDGAAATSRQKIIRGLSYITVEPAIIGSLFVLYMYSTLGKQYIFYRLAQDYNLTKTSWETSCNGTSAESDNTDYILFQRVSTETSQWIIYMSIATFIPAIYSTIALGSWSDKHGRKIPILVSLVGFIILIVTYVIVINMNAPVPYLIIGHVLCGLCGDSSTLLACSFSHVTDITKPKERTFRISVIEACIGVAGFVASLSGGVWLDRKGFVSPFWFLLGLTVVDFFYILFRIESNDEKWFGNLKHLFSKDPFVHMYDVLKPQEDNSTRHISIILYLTCFFILITSTVGIAVILVVYEIGLPFCWNPIQVGISQSIVQAGYFSMLILVKLFSGITAEVKLILAGIISNAASCFILAFAIDDWMIYFGLVVQMLYLLPSPVLRSQMSRLVSIEETGPVFALQSCAANISTIIASTLFNVVFGATVDSSVPGAAFLLSPMLLLIFLPIFRAAYKMSKQSLFNELQEEKFHVEDKL